MNPQAKEWLDGLHEIESGRLSDCRNAEDEARKRLADCIEDTRGAEERLRAIACQRAALEAGASINRITLERMFQVMRDTKKAVAYDWHTGTWFWYDRDEPEAQHGNFEEAIDAMTDATDPYINECDPHSPLTPTHP